MFKFVDYKTYVTYVKNICKIYYIIIIQILYNVRGFSKSNNIKFFN